MVIDGERLRAIRGPRTVEAVVAGANAVAQGTHPGVPGFVRGRIAGLRDTIARAEVMRSVQEVDDLTCRLLAAGLRCSIWDLAPGAEGYAGNGTRQDERRALEKVVALHARAACRAKRGQRR